ncbi:MAG: hypothetical protein O7C73_07865 [Nitrospirae bacterium]|nr:hypothetical protein [Nitrospirota bacterium]
MSHHERVIGKPTPKPLRDLAAIFHALFLPHKHEALIPGLRKMEGKKAYELQTRIE